MRKKILLLTFIILITLTSCNYQDSKLSDNQDTQIDTSNVVEEFKIFLKSLSSKDFHSSGIALQKLKELKGDNKLVNDNLCREYIKLYNEIQYSQEFFDTEQYKDKGSILKENGYIELNTPGGEWGITHQPEFLVETFSEIVSDGFKKYLEIENKFMNEPTSIDGYMAIPWNELSSRIINCEKFLEKHMDYPEAERVKRIMDIYIKEYTTSSGMMLQFLFKEMILTPEAQNSYENFISSYPHSHYYKLIKGYYEILENNDFMLNDQAKEFLRENEIDISWFDAGI
jgi:hypothetical protein